MAGELVAVDAGGGYVGLRLHSYIFTSPHRPPLACLACRDGSLAQDHCARSRSYRTRQPHPATISRRDYASSGQILPEARCGAPGRRGLSGEHLRPRQGDLHVLQKGWLIGRLV